MKTSSPFFALTDKIEKSFYIDDTLEPVLEVPPHLTKSAYATLVLHDCVPRKWHWEGRYGSRTHTIVRNKGIPLSRSASILTCPNEEEELRELLHTPGVKISFRPPVPLPLRILPNTNAALHLERASPCFPSVLLQYLKSDCQLYSEKKSSFTFVDLFAGIGGFALALERLGGHCVLASELSPPCAATYLANFSPTNMQGDINIIQHVPNHDLLVGGFPCQPFSSLGLQPGFHEEGRGQLYTHIVRVLQKCQPRAFLLENVPGLLSTENGRAFSTILTALEGAGYDVSFEVCSSRGLTAQARKRLFIVGLLRSNNNHEHETALTPFEFPFTPDLGLRAGDIIHTEHDFIDYVRQTSVTHHGSPEELFRLSQDQLNQLLTRSKYWKPAKLAWEDTVCDTLDSHYGVTVGKGNSQLVPSSAPHHPRLFTPRECARLMGFPNSFTLLPKPELQGWNAYRKEQYHMLGNAVCPPLVAALAGAILSRFLPENDWAEHGSMGAIKLALEALTPSRRLIVKDRLMAEFELQIGQVLINTCSLFNI